MSALLSRKGFSVTQIIKLKYFFMKKFILIIAVTAFINKATAQSTSEILKQQAGQGVKEGATIATENVANKVTDKVLNSIFSKKKKSVKTTQPPDVASNNNYNATTNGLASNSAAINNTPDASLQTYSKYDFVPGEKILVYEDFSKDAIGDFPGN